MSLYDVFFPFKLYNSYFEDIPEDDEEGDVKELKTIKIKVNTTYDEVINFSRPYINRLFEKYKNYHIDGVHTKKTTIRLYISFMENSDVHELPLFGICFDNIKNEICGSMKFQENEEIKDKEFSINIFVFLPYSNGIDDEEEEVVDEDDEEEEVIIPKTTNTINEEVCVVCYAKKPNIIYTDCYHLCSKCDEEGEFFKCPLCRIPIKNNKIKFEK